jgi:UPF0176 protein
MAKELRNLTCQEKLKEQIQNDPTPRTTISFYQYAAVEEPALFRDELFENLSALGVLGRIYVAQEGINAQISVPNERLDDFRIYLYSFPFLDGIRLNIAVEDDGKSFWVLKIRVREKIVADGITDQSFDVTNRGEYLSAEEFNRITAVPETIIVDMRNYYEYEVGHFADAIEIPADTFREQLPMAAEILADKKDVPVVMYCTGGIRCEKASAYLKHQGFRQVFHLEGGIIKYVHDVREKGLENKFKGKNFVFDSRLGERISDDVLAVCHQCGEVCDTHTNCENRACHLLFIQCENCREKFSGCCSDECREISHLPEETQKDLRRGKSSKSMPFNNSRKRIRPRLHEIN